MLWAGLMGGAWGKQWPAEYEARIGKEAAAEVEKKWKVIADEARQKQIEEIAAAIAAVSARPDVKYTIKIIDEKEINAFSLPGGYIYITKGLLEDVQSEHELAAVLAHEIAHNAHYDALERAEKSQKLFMGSLAATIVAMIVGARGEDVSAVLTAGEYIRLGVLSHYSMQVETRADTNALKYLIASKRYNPVGMLTFMERLAARERRKPQIELGVYADHPDTDIRVRQIIELLEAAGIEINRRAVTKWEPPKVEEKEREGRKYVVLSLWGVDIMQTEYAPDGQTPQQWLEKLAAQLRTALEEGLEAYQIRAEIRKDAPARIFLGPQEWLSITPEAAAKNGASPEEWARQIVANLSAALHKEKLQRWM